MKLEFYLRIFLTATDKQRPFTNMMWSATVYFAR